jgi:predicted dehydrogenase
MFIKRASLAAGGLVFPAVIPSSALGHAGSVAAGNRITVGCIGVGWQGGGNLQRFLGMPDVQVVAVCDVDRNHLAAARDAVNGKYGNSDCTAYGDFRELIARRDIDALSLALPDHWHGIPAVAGLKAGKDIYGEKPLSHNWAEGKAILDAARAHGRVWQTGSWQRSRSHFRHACELVLNGRIGRVSRVEVGLPSGHADFANTRGQEAPSDPPAHLDYDFWLGPAPVAPYCPARVHKNWRWHLDYGGGQLLDWVGHHLDIAHWGLGFDDTGPLEIEGVGEYPETGLWNTATRYRLTARYPKDIAMIIAGGHGDIRGGTRWIGDAGWVWVNRGAIEASDPKLLQEKFTPQEIHLYRSPGHQREFIDCVKTRGRTLTPADVAHRSATPGHLGQIAMLLGRKIKWDPTSERIINDPQAERMLSRPMRAPWTL